MKLKITDKERISKRRCEIYPCREKSVAIANTKLMCEIHFKEIRPDTEKRMYRNHWLEKRIRENKRKEQIANKYKLMKIQRARMRNPVGVVNN